MSKTLVTTLIVVVCIGIWVSFDTGYRLGQKNPDIATIGLTKEQYPQLVKRCKNLMEAEKMADIVIGVMEEETK